MTIAFQPLLTKSERIRPDIIFTAGLRSYTSPSSESTSSFKTHPSPAHSCTHLGTYPHASPACYQICRYAWQIHIGLYIHTSCFLPFHATCTTFHVHIVFHLTIWNTNLLAWTFSISRYEIREIEALHVHGKLWLSSRMHFIKSSSSLYVAGTHYVDSNQR